MSEKQHGEASDEFGLYPRMISELYQGKLPVLIPMVPGEKVFWAVYDVPEQSVLVCGDGPEREDCITAIVKMTAEVAWQP